MKSLFRFLIAFFAITGAVAVSTGVLGIQFGRAEFWAHHGFLFLVFITIFPRLTLVLSDVATGGLLWWLGWLFAPRLLVAVLATLVYWNQNPVLVVFSWLVALGGESSEKYAIVQRSSRSRQKPKRGYEEAKWVETESR